MMRRKTTITTMIVQHGNIPRRVVALYQSLDFRPRLHKCDVMDLFPNPWRSLKRILAKDLTRWKMRDQARVRFRSMGHLSLVETLLDQIFKNRPQTPAVAILDNSKLSCYLALCMAGIEWINILREKASVIYTKCNEAMCLRLKKQEVTRNP